MTGKEERLVAAARKVLHRQGYAAMTLATVAHAANVPLGNVYYYFSKKRELGDAVVASRVAQLRAWLGDLDAAPEPVERLRAFVMNFADGAETYAVEGCPFANLAHDLEREPELAPATRELFAIQLQWLERQFRLSRAERARERAAELLSAVHGACLVARALGDAALLRRRMVLLARELTAATLPRVRTS
ncbi:MAG: TetR/AcrR family transcriptional regulator [Deltaproteobacteria bacterium]|nr:TetR/AcrR family transcriptional regulator [Nannocystaceae bacterium]